MAPEEEGAVGYRHLIDQLWSDGSPTSGGDIQYRVWLAVSVRRKARLLWSAETANRTRTRASQPGISTRRDGAKRKIHSDRGAFGQSWFDLVPLNGDNPCNPAIAFGMECWLRRDSDGMPSHAHAVKVEIGIILRMEPAPAKPYGI
jgi:hypothetical protein